MQFVSRNFFNAFPAAPGTGTCLQPGPRVIPGSQPPHPSRRAGERTQRALQSGKLGLNSRNATYFFPCNVGIIASRCETGRVTQERCVVEHPARSKCSVNTAHHFCAIIQQRSLLLPVNTGCILGGRGLPEGAFPRRLRWETVSLNPVPGG